MKTFLFLGLSALVLVPACTSTVGGGGGGAGTGACTLDTDCSADQMCGFPASDACEAQGQCFPAPMALCQAYSPGCGCDGTVMTTVCNGLPVGYVRRPLAYMGECVDGG